MMSPNFAESRSGILNIAFLKVTLYIDHNSLSAEICLIKLLILIVSLFEFEENELIDMKAMKLSKVMKRKKFLS